jgi:iron only hydrogenase large subunit-like protein/nitrogen-specific signal transduction histidine kinase
MVAMGAAYITTIKERCRMCYTCVRECPAKAIRIATGQAEVIAERCIACGNCVRVCSQKAKQAASSIDQVDILLASGKRVAACLAPSFPAEFSETDYRQLVGMIRELGFTWVMEVSFGADLVAREYRKLLSETNGHRYITTHCPAIIGYVERYHPELVPCLAPIVSPMIATARIARRTYGKQIGVVFVGPCIAKKAEIDGKPVDGEVDAVLTFDELRQMIASAQINSETIEPSEFDPPYGSAGGLFPIGRGMLQAANIQEDLMTGEVVSSQGRSQMVEAIKEFADGDLGAKLLEALCCEGCIMGAGITNDLPLFSRRRQVRHYVRQRMEALDQWHWHEDMQRAADLDLSRSFAANDQRIPTPGKVEFIDVMARMGKFTPQDELNCGACGYDTCREHAIAICKGLAESEMCLPFTIEQLRRAVKEVEESNRQLAEAQEVQVQLEKMASMGQLAAGIAHEVNNPLGVVLMYAHLLLDSCDSGSPLREDLVMIAEQADRCKKIVAGLLHFARQNKLVRYPADLREQVDRALKTIRIPDNIVLQVEHDLEDPVAEIDRDQIVQVLTNLITNAIAAMDKGGTLTVQTGGDDRRVFLRVRDTGVGIPEENLKKIYEPFFTTKPMGKGTGLGLAVTYGIIKMHCGDIRVQSNTNAAAGPTGTTFTVTLPRREQ